jgi:hypothetical protein
MQVEILDYALNYQGLQQPKNEKLIKENMEGEFVWKKK